MKKRYGETKTYEKNRAIKIARNKSRRKDYKGRGRDGLTNPKRIQNEIKPPREIRLLSNGVGFYRDKFTFTAPKILSFKTNPEETIQLIDLIASALLSKSSQIDLVVNFNNTIEIDIGALSIIDVIIYKGMDYINRTGRLIHVHGVNPVDPEANCIFSHSGLPRIFNNFMGQMPNVITLDPLNNNREAFKETEKIINYYDSCLQINGYELNNKGKVFFYELINEIVDNAIIHCGSKNPTYITCGYYNHSIKKGQLSIVSIGKSMFDTLASKSTLESIKSDITEIVQIQKKLGYRNFSEENIWTICALQSGVSCKKTDNDSDNGSSTMDRGTGTVKFIEAFIALGQSNKNEKPIMTLISGNTHILFDGKYKMVENNSGHKTIAFNINNNLKEKPDPEYVKIINSRFPGVIINIEFYIDPEYLDQFKEDEHREELGN